MRYISLRGHQPDSDWLDKASELLKAMKAAPDAEARGQIIDDNKRLWSDLKVWLLQLSHGKCWFSEAKDVFSHWDVEHFRPKKVAKDEDGTEHEGYWWLAFDWKNFRICGNAGNRRKGSYFPLRAGCKRTVSGGDLRHEDPIMLDPTDANDPGLLSFNLEGRAIPSPAAQSEWEKKRVEYSVQRCNLDFPALMERRKTVWVECVNKVNTYLNELDTCNADPNNAIARYSCKESAKDICTMIRADKELSTVARACIISMGNDQLTKFLQSA